MIKINLVCVGNLKEKFWTEAVNEYFKRISRFANFSIYEVAEKRTVDEEGRELLKRAKGYKIAFDIGGEQLSSEGLADFLKKLCNEGRSEITFFIGGSDGLSEEVKRSADKKISFGKVTYPHQLMRVIASEQLYRAMTIINGLPYHK